MALFRVFCRAETARIPSAYMIKGPCICSNNVCGDINRTREAINSIANGTPSRCAQMEATACTFFAFNEKSGLTARARSANNIRAGKSDTFSISTSTENVSCGKSSTGTWNNHSPGTRNDSRLVAMIFKWGQSERRPEASKAESSIRCSRLSSMISICFSPMPLMSSSIEN